MTGLAATNTIAIIGSLGIWELLIILFIAMLVFGASRLGSLGKGIREFKDELIGDKPKDGSKSADGAASEGKSE